MRARVLRHKVTGRYWVRTRGGSLLDYNTDFDRACAKVRDLNRQADKDAVYADLGMRKVHGALGGTYYE